MKIETIRNLFNADSTGGQTEVDGKFFCHSQEDAARPYGVKIPKVTCIPDRIYQVGIRYSPSIERDMLILYTESDKETIIANGVTFKYVYQHGGVNATHSSGCILSGYNRIDAFSIQDTSEHDLFALVAPAIRSGERVTWHVINDPSDQLGLRGDWV